MNATQVVPVIFRAWLSNERVIAFFPTLPGDIHGYYCSSYEHIGQHGVADYHHCIEKTRPTRGKEATGLKLELEQLGYLLHVKKRATAAMHNERKIEADKRNIAITTTPRM